MCTCCRAGKSPRPAEPLAAPKITAQRFRQQVRKRKKQLKNTAQEKHQLSHLFRELLQHFKAGALSLTLNLGPGSPACMYVGQHIFGLRFRFDACEARSTSFSHISLAHFLLSQKLVNHSRLFPIRRFFKARKIIISTE